MKGGGWGGSGGGSVCHSSDPLQLGTTQRKRLCNKTFYAILHTSSNVFLYFLKHFINEHQRYIDAVTAKCPSCRGRIVWAVCECMCIYISFVLLSLVRARYQSRLYQPALTFWPYHMLHAFHQGWCTTRSMWHLQTCRYVNVYYVLSCFFQFPLNLKICIYCITDI